MRQSCNKKSRNLSEHSRKTVKSDFMAGVPRPAFIQLEDHHYGKFSRIFRGTSNEISDTPPPAPKKVKIPTHQISISPIVSSATLDDDYPDLDDLAAAHDQNKWMKQGSKLAEEDERKE